MRIIDKIRSRENLTPTESTLAIFLQEHSKEATNMSLNELAETLHASKVVSFVSVKNWDIKVIKNYVFN